MKYVAETSYQLPRALALVKRLIGKLLYRLHIRPRLDSRYGLL